MDDDALMAKLMAAFDDDAAPDQAGDEPRPSEQPFDTQRFLAGLDAIFDAHAAAKAGPYLEQAMIDAENAGDDAGLLTVLNETMGFYRSQGRHKENQWIVQRALELATRMGITGTEAWTTTLINAATAMRAAGQYDQSEDLYKQAQASSERTLAPSDRRLAALHNNLSMLYSETGKTHQAEVELGEALRILESSSPDAETDLDVASTHTNLALTLLAEDKLSAASWHAAKALEIYRNGHLEHSSHYASALAGYAQVRFHQHDYGQAVNLYCQALQVIEECYGKDTDYYRITESNLRQAEHEASEHAPANVSQDVSQDASAGGNGSGTPGAAPAGTPSAAVPSATASPTGTSPICGLKLARECWNAYGKPLIADKYPGISGAHRGGTGGPRDRNATGFMTISRATMISAHGFCLWLTDEDYAAIGERLQADYEALPQSFMGYGPRESTARAQGAGRRDGVFRIGDFFESITGYRQAPSTNNPHEWLMLDEATLAAATNGEVFADPLGKFLDTRQGFKAMPEDVRLALISKRLGMMAQAGQYNVPRMLARGDGAAAWLSIGEFVQAAASLVFLLNNPITVGYLPYYKWRFAALRRLSSRMATRLADVCGQLETLLRLSSAACYGGAGFGEGGKGSAPVAEKISQTIEHVCAEVVAELRREGLTGSDETFLEWQRPYVEEHIASDAACLHSL